MYMVKDAIAYIGFCNIVSEWTIKILTIEVMLLCSSCCRRTSFELAGVHLLTKSSLVILLKRSQETVSRVSSQFFSNKIFCDLVILLSRYSNKYRQ